MLDVGYCQDDFQSFFQNLESLFQLIKNKASFKMRLKSIAFCTYFSSLTPLDIT